MKSIIREISYKKLSKFVLIIKKEGEKANAAVTHPSGHAQVSRQMEKKNICQLQRAE